VLCTSIDLYILNKLYYQYILVYNMIKVSSILVFTQPYSYEAEQSTLFPRVGTLQPLGCLLVHGGVHMHSA